jgi:hypothetical protein
MLCVLGVRHAGAGAHIETVITICTEHTWCICGVAYVVLHVEIMFGARAAHVHVEACGFHLSLSLSLFHSLCALFSACKLLQQTCGSGYSLVNGAPHPITMSIEISDDELVGHDMPDLLALCRDFGYDDSADEGFSHTCKNPSQALD